MTRAILLVLAVIGVCGQVSPVQAQHLHPSFGNDPLLELLSQFESDEVEEEDVTDDEIEAYMNLLIEIARQQQQPRQRQSGVDRRAQNGAALYPPPTPRQPVPLQQPQGASRQDLMQLLQLRKGQAAYLERQFPLLQQQAASYRQISNGMGTTGYILQSQFDNQVRICQVQYAAVTADIQAIEARLGGFGR